MTAPVASSILLPDDTSNAGKRVRTQTKTVGGLTVHEHFHVPSVAMTLTGSYIFNSAQKAVINGTQDGTTTASLWLQNPVASTITALIRSIMASLSANAAVAAPTAPAIAFTKFTFSGTASGAQETAEPMQTAGAVNQMLVRTAVTGMTPTLRKDVGRIQVPAIITAAGVYGAIVPVYNMDPLAFQRGMDVELAPGEGLVIYQPTAGTVSDPRVFGVQVAWDEMDLS